MCVWGFGCCGPPPHATFKVYPNTSPWELESYDLIDLAPFRESAVSLWNPGGFTPASPAISAAPGDGSATRETALLVRDVTDSSRHEASSSSPLSAPSPAAGAVTLVDDTATLIWWVQRNNTLSCTAAAFDSSLAQSCSLSLTQTGSDAYQSAGCSQTDPSLFLGRIRAGTATGSVVERYTSAGALIDSIAKSALTATGGRTVQSAGGAVTRDAQTVVVYGVERTSTAFWRRYWTLDPSNLNETGASTGAAVASANLNGHMALGGAPCVSTSHLFALIGSTWVCVSLSTLAELWTLAASSSNAFLGLDSSNIYTINTSTRVVTARAVATGTPAWTCDLSANWSGSVGHVFAKRLSGVSGGNLAVVSAGRGVAIINPSTGALITTIDVMAYDVVETASRYIVVGPKRTTEV